MIDLKQAVANAKAFAADAFCVEDFLLEDVSSDEEEFRVTVSFPHRLSDTVITSPLFRGLRNSPREYKSFDVNKNTGEVGGMAMRAVG